MNVASRQIDFSAWFMPQRLTPLFFTPAYTQLTDAQRLRYNQLHALYLNEQTMFFEKALPGVLRYFLRRDLDPKLRAAVEKFAADEERHSAMFRSLNLRSEPELYRDHDFYFIHVPALPGKALNFIALHPRHFPLLLWLMHLQEERALSTGREFLMCEHVIEPNFLAAQRAHIADEVSHVHCDKALLDLVWPQANRFTRWLNVRLLGWMMTEYFGPPKRAQVKVVERLCAEFDALPSKRTELRAALFALKHNTEYLKSLYSRENVPDAFERFDRSPEFGPLSKAMPGYHPNYAV